MKNRLVITFLLTVLSFGAATASESVAAFNVATYNLRQLNGGDDAEGNGWFNRCPVIAGIIRFHEFDIFGTQEGFKSQLEDLKTSLPGYEYIGVGREDGREAGEHSAIFYNTEMFDLVEHGDFWLSETPDRPGLGWDAACTRICSWGIFRHKPSGKLFRFYNLHLDHVGERARVESILLVERMMREQDGAMPSFLTGDFNVDQHHEMYGVLASSRMLNDAFLTAEFVFALNGTYNGYRTDGYTDSRIDHILVSDGVRVRKYGVLTDTYRTPVDADDPDQTRYVSRTPSDHFPVMARVEF